MFGNVPHTLVVDNWVDKYVVCKPEPCDAVELRLLKLQRCITHCKKRKCLHILSRCFDMSNMF